MSKTIIVEYKIFSANPHLSDEDPDPMEREDIKDGSLNNEIIEGWTPWTAEDLLDIRNIIARMEPKEQFIFEAYLDGMTYIDISVTEKYWRYHFAKGLEIIKKELDV
jgi:hypothetical protein